MITAIKSSWRGYSMELWVPIFLVASALALPLSTTAKSILVPLAILGIVFNPAYRRDLATILYQPWCQASLLLFALACLACAWSPASLHEKLFVVEKYSKLLYFPILAVGFRDPKLRYAALYALLVAMVITCCTCYLKVAGIIKIWDGDPGNLFYNHIITGNMMAFSSYVAALLMIRQKGKIRIVYAALILMFGHHIFFLTQGRTVYIMFALLMTLLMVQLLPWRKALLAMLLGCSFMAVMYSQSATMQDGFNRVIYDWKSYSKNNKATPIGDRLQFHAYAKKLFLKHPWIGNGTASFTHYFNEEKPVADWNKVLLEPHSQYWLVLAEFGCLGIVILLFFLGSLLLASLRLQSMRPIGLAMIIPFCIGNLTDSLLFYSGSGYFFIVFMALALGEGVKTPKPAF